MLRGSGIMPQPPFRHPAPVEIAATIVLRVERGRGEHAVRSRQEAAARAVNLAGAPCTGTQISAA